MGSALTCLCSNSFKDQVIIMKENGDLIKFNKGVLVKEVIAGGAHHGHKIVRYGAERVVLSNSTILQCNRLYFLVPEDLVLQDKIYDKFIKVAETRRLIPRKVDHQQNNTVINGQVMVGQMLLLDASDLRSSPWRPRLQTIPEILSPLTPKS